MGFEVEKKQTKTIAVLQYAKQLIIKNKKKNKKKNKSCFTVCETANKHGSQQCKFKFYFGN